MLRDATNQCSLWRYCWKDGSERGWTVYHHHRERYKLHDQSIPSKHRERLIYPVDPSPDCELFCGLDSSQSVLLTHGDSVLRLADDLRTTAMSSSDLVAALEHKSQRVFGLQFHPEADLTLKGVEMFKSFLYNVSPFSFL